MGVSISMSGGGDTGRDLETNKYVNTEAPYTPNSASAVVAGVGGLWLGLAPAGGAASYEIRIAEAIVYSGGMDVSTIR